jgi:hypothetical protein
MKVITIPPDALARFRAASSEFALTPKSRASRLEAVRDDIAALRGKGASFRTISELLGRCGIRASDTCVMRFCRRVLGETPTRARKVKHRDSSRQSGQSAKSTAGSPNGKASPSAAAAPSEAAQVALLDDLLSYQPSSDDKPAAQGGPRIAKIKFASPSEL